VSDAWSAALAQGGDHALLRHFRCVVLQERDRIEVVFASSPEPPSSPRFQFDFTTPREGKARLATCYTVWRTLPDDVYGPVIAPSGLRDVRCDRCSHFS